MADVVSPRGVTYSVTCHQWFTNGLSSILTFPTIWVHRCSVSHVSCHASNGNDGHSSTVSPRLVLLVLSIVFFSCWSLLFQVSSLEGRHSTWLAASRVGNNASCSQKPRYKTPLMKKIGAVMST